MLNTFHKRLVSTLILTPGVMLFLVWVGRFAGAETVVEMGILSFLLWSVGVAFGISATITLYVACLTKAADKE